MDSQSDTKSAMAEEPKSPSEKYSTPTEGESLLSNNTSDAQGQLAAAVDELLDQLQHKFDNVSKEMFGKLDDMTRRLDELEASLNVSSNDATAAATPSK